MSNTVTFFLPTRKGSERVPNKNTRPFAGIEGGLLENKIKQLLSTKHLDEIILSTNDETCMNIAEKYTSDSRLRIVPRPEELCLSSALTFRILSVMYQQLQMQTTYYGDM